MSPIAWLCLILIGMGAGFVQRVSGFGLGIFTMMFLPHFMPSHTDAATISTLFSCLTSTYNAIRYRKNVAYQAALPLIGAALFSIPVAVYFSANVSAKLFEMLLGALLVLLSVYFLFFNRNVRFKPTATGGALAGALSGILNGLFSTGGPPVVLYLSNALTENTVYFATIQFYFAFTNWYAVFSRALSGIIRLEILLYAAVGMVGCMAGDFLGRAVFDKMDFAKLKTVIYVGMIISGILMFF